VRGRWEVGGGRRWEGRRGEVGGGRHRRREVGKREKFWGREETEKKKKTLGREDGFLVHPKTASTTSSSTGALVACWFTPALYYQSLQAVSATNFLLLDFIITPSKR